MEDSEKRKERLRAMRTEAAQAEASVNFASSGPLGGLSNPLADTSFITPRTEERTRFDFYTDPMAAFSGNKRNKPDKQIKQDRYNAPRHQTGPLVSQFSPSPPPGPRIGHSPHQIHSDQRIYGAPGHYNNNSQHMGPRAMLNPPFLHQRNFSEAWNGFRAPAGNPPPPGVPMGMPCHFQMNQGTWNSFGGRGNYPAYPPPCLPGPNRGPANTHWPGKSSGPSFGHGGNRHPSQGRGRGSDESPNQSLGQNSGRGRGFHFRDRPGGSASGPECFYKNSMVEDPWKDLEPILWQSSDTSSDSWLPKSITMTKPRVFEASGTSNSGQSLAEYLAASFSEVKNEDPGV